MSDVEHVLPCRNKLGEGPIWSVDEQVLYWVDIQKDSFSRYDPVSDTHEITNVGVPIGVMAERASGGLIMATKKGFALWDGQALTYIAQPFGENPALRFNDGAVDCAGRFWAGSMPDGVEVPEGGVLYRLDPDGSVHEMIKGVRCSNGIGWSPDNTIMYFTDSDLHKIFAFDFNVASGEITNQRVFADNEGEASVPDGLTVDSEGYVWSAYWDGAKIVRYDPTGQVERELEVPVLRPTSCVFGGSALTDLYITSASVDEVERENYPFSGDLFRLKTEVKGLPKYKFAG